MQDYFPHTFLPSVPLSLLPTLFPSEYSRPSIHSGSEQSHLGNPHHRYQGPPLSPGSAFPGSAFLGSASASNSNQTSRSSNCDQPNRPGLCTPNPAMKSRRTNTRQRNSRCLAGIATPAMREPPLELDTVNHLNSHDWSSNQSLASTLMNPVWATATWAEISCLPTIDRAG